MKLPTENGEIQLLVQFSSNVREVIGHKGCKRCARGLEKNDCSCLLDVRYVIRSSRLVVETARFATH